MTRLIVLTELINPKKEISFSLSSISQHQSNYHNRTQTSLLKTGQPSYITRNTPTRNQLIVPEAVSRPRKQ